MYLLTYGFRCLQDENVPLWCWFANLGNRGPTVALVSSMSDQAENERIGAIEVLTALESELSSEDYAPKREFVLGRWFSESSPATVRSAALEYLSRLGMAQDLEIVKNEFEKNESKTRAKALGCMLKIMRRSGQADTAHQLVLDAQYEMLNASLLDEIVINFGRLSDEDLSRALEHRTPQVRLLALREMKTRCLVSEDIVNRVLTDDDAVVRNEGLSISLALGQLFADEKIREILVPRQTRGERGLLEWASWLSGEGRVGEDLYLKHRTDRLKALSESELAHSIATNSGLDDLPYFVRAERFFSKYSSDLRRHVDNRFVQYVEERIRSLATATHQGIDDNYTLATVRYRGAFLKQELTRFGLDVLCRVGDREDLERVRNGVQDLLVERSILDVKFLRRHGSWQDVLLLSNAVAEPRGGLTTGTGENDFVQEVAKAVLKLSAGQSHLDVFSPHVPERLLTKLVEFCPGSRFAAIPKTALFGLLDHEAESVRKSAAQKVAFVFPKSRINSILDECIDDDEHRYYNVIHWLDLGASMSRSVARRVILSVTN